MAPKVGIVGSPDELSLLIPLFQSLRFSVSAIWCGNHDNCRSLATKYSVHLAARDFQEVLLSGEVDLVYVATAPILRAEVAVKAMTSGKHCICQQPISVGECEGKKMVNVSRYYPQLLSLAECQWRFLPASVRMRELVETGYCGRVLTVEARVWMDSLIHSDPFSWRCDSSVGGGALSEIGSHIIDLITFTTRQQIIRVQGTLKTFRPQTEAIHGYRRITGDDFCSLHAELEGRGFATLTINTHLPHHYKFEFSITGTSGALSLRGMDLFGTTVKSGEEKCLYRQKLTELPIPVHLLHKYPAEFYQPLLIGCQEMLRALRDDFEHSNHSLAPRRESLNQLIPAATMEDGFYVRTVLDAAAESSITGQWVEVEKVTLADSYNPFWTSSDVIFNREKSRSPTKHRPSLT